MAIKLSYSMAFKPISYRNIAYPLVFEGKWISLLYELPCVLGKSLLVIFLIITRECCCFFFIIIVESLVHIQWEDECGKRHTSCIKPCSWVWRWWCQRRSNGKEAYSPLLESNNFIACLYKWVKLHDQWCSVYGSSTATK